MKFWIVNSCIQITAVTQNGSGVIFVNTELWMAALLAGHHGSFRVQLGLVFAFVLNLWAISTEPGLDLGLGLG